MLLDVCNMRLDEKMTMHVVQIRSATFEVRPAEEDFSVGVGASRVKFKVTQVVLNATVQEFLTAWYLCSITHLCNRF